MFKRVFLAAVLMISAAQAQAVVVLRQEDLTFEIKGIVDAGVTVADKVGTANKTATMFSSNTIRTSQISFMATQVIDNDLSAGVKLTHQVTSGTGENGVQASDGNKLPMWNIASYVFVDSKSLGRLQLGRQDGIFFRANLIGDPRGYMNFGAGYNYWGDSSTFGGGTTKTGLGTLTGSGQLSNVIRYDSPEFGDKFQLQGMWVPGGVGGNFDASSRYGLNLYYKGIPGLTAVIGTQYVNATTGKASVRDWLVGANYQWDKYTIAGEFVKLENPTLSQTDTANSEFNYWTVNGIYQATPKLKLSAGYYQLDDEIDNRNGSHQFTMVADYALSKSLFAYTGWAQVHNKGASGFAAFGPGGDNLNSLNSGFSSKVTVPGQVQNAVTLGLRFEF